MDEEQGERNTVRRVAAWVGVTLAAFALHGYHPYSEDGGIYAAGVKRALDPGLYPRAAMFVDAHLGMSVFVPFMRDVVRVTHAPLVWVLLAAHLLSVGATLFGVWEIARRCFAGLGARCGAVALMAVSLTLPIAGTSLCFLDPYVTARSFSTPLALLALAWMVGRLRGERGRLLLALAAALGASLFHPLMGGYLVGGMAFLYCAMRSRWKSAAALCAAAVLVAVAVHALSGRASEAYEAVVRTRDYWFMSRWQWYEVLGAIAPLLIFAGLQRLRMLSQELRAICAAALLLGLTGLLVAICCVNSGSGHYMVARLQPLRTLHLAYGVLIVALGGLLGETIDGMRNRVTAGVLGGGLIAGLALISGSAQVNLYAHSHHLEMPWMRPQNGWVQAFVWARENTARDALFALDADYITQPDEDAQCFRAFAERSSLPDYSKDGGVASLAPWMADAWGAGQMDQTGLSRMTDAERSERLKDAGVSWMVLRAETPTLLPCEYSNSVVKVCRLGDAVRLR